MCAREDPSFRVGPGHTVLAVDDKRLGDDVFDAHARIERGVRILEDNLHAAAQVAQFPWKR